MSDTYTEVTTRSWGSRLKGSFKGILVGLLLVFGSFLVLFTNEGRAVRRHKALAEGARDVVPVNADAVLPANEGRLVHLSGPATTDETLRDPDFGIAIRAIHLDRQVEMFQWQESSESRTEKKTGGSTETTTTYSYTTGWSDRHIDSRRFKRPTGHANPPSMQFESGRTSAQRVMVGAFQLGPSLIGSIGDRTELPVRTIDNLPSSLKQRARLDDGGLYIGHDPAAPEVGDLRVRFSYVAPQVVTIVAGQNGSTLDRYQTRSGGTLALLRTGNATAEEMFTAAVKANKTLTWILRAVGFLMMLVGFRTVLAPFGVMADVLPFLGNLVSRGATLVAGALALPLSLFTIALAWLWYRPLLAVGLLALGALASFGLLRLIKRARAARSEPPESPPELPPLPSS